MTINNTSLVAAEGILRGDALDINGRNVTVTSVRETRHHMIEGRAVALTFDYGSVVVVPSAFLYRRVDA